jgi:hypothetical protein
MRARRGRAAALALGVLVGLGACAPSTQRATGGQTIAVEDLRSLAGRWAGLMDLPGHRADDQYVEIEVRPDGTYRATSARTIGLMDARGTVALSEGRLFVQGEGGARGHGTLVSRDGQPVLMLDMTRADGGRITARLRPQQ